MVSLTKAYETETKKVVRSDNTKLVFAVPFEQCDICKDKFFDFDNSFICRKCIKKDNNYQEK